MTREAARASDADGLLRCAYEALRFRPQTPALLRYAQRDATLAPGARVPGGHMVLAFCHVRSGSA